MVKSPTVFFYVSGVLAVVTAVVAFLSGAKPAETSIINQINDELNKAVTHINPVGFAGSISEYLNKPDIPHLADVLREEILLDQQISDLKREINTQEALQRGGRLILNGDLNEKKAKLAELQKRRDAAARIGFAPKPPPTGDSGYFSKLPNAVGYAFQKAAGEGWVSFGLVLASLAIGAVGAYRLRILHPVGALIAVLFFGGLFLFVVKAAGTLLLFALGTAQALAAVPFAVALLTAANGLLVMWINHVNKVGNGQAAPSTNQTSSGSADLPPGGSGPAAK